MAVRPIDAIELQRRMCALCNQDYSDEPCEPSDCVFIRAINEMPTLTPANEPRMINADILAKRIAGHSNYHGDSILAAIYCAAEGKEKDTPIRPIENPPNEWVSVEERLPPPKQNVLAYSLESGIAEADYGDGVWMQYRWSAVMRGVTHWMPLPAPPERHHCQEGEDT